MRSRVAWLNAGAPKNVLLGESELVFSSLKGTPLHEEYILVRDYWPPLTATGLPKEMRLYDLRHTHASLLLLAGVHPKVVSERLGHRSIVITLDPTAMSSRACSVRVRIIWIPFFLVQLTNRATRAR